MSNLKNECFILSALNDQTHMMSLCRVCSSMKKDQKVCPRLNYKDALVCDDQHILKFQHFTSVMFIWVLVEQANHYSQNIFSKIDIQWTGYLKTNALIQRFNSVIFCPLAKSCFERASAFNPRCRIIMTVLCTLLFCKVLFFFLLFSSFFLSFFLVFLLSFLLLFFFHFFSFFLFGGERHLGHLCLCWTLKFHFWLKVQGTDVYLACWRRK